MSSISRVCISILGMLSIAAALFFSGPSFAGTTFWPDPGISLQVDQISHELMLNGTDPSPASALAFKQRAMTHDLFDGGGFTFGRAEPRL